jgi:hypothetical protein
MSTSTRSPRRLLKLAGAAVIGTAVAALFATPAFAWSAGVEGTPECADNGTVTVTWTLTNHEERSPAKYRVTEHAPSDSTITNGEGDLPKGGTATITQTGVPSDTAASITVHVVWFDRYGHVADKKDVPGDVEGIKCEKPSPSPSVSPTNGGGGGGEGTPTPSTTAVPPTLPVTGPNAAIYGGGAAALLVAGGTLFIVARRRRIRFEA